MLSPLRIYMLMLLLSTATLCSSQVQFVAFAGPQATTANYKVRGNKQSTRLQYGFVAGLALKIPFEEQLYFYPSVYYSAKGYKVTLKDSAFPPTEFAINNRVQVHTIELSPLFHIDLSKKPSHPFVRFGPSIDFAFSGKEKFDTLGLSGTRGSVERAMNFDFTEYGRITAQVSLHAGFEHGRGWMVYAFYEHGIGSMNNADDGPSILHRIYGISFGWVFRHNPLSMDTGVKR